MADGKILELEQRIQQLKRLVELSVTLNSTLDLDTLLQLVTDTGVELLACQSASILLYDEKQPRLYFAAATGSDPKKLAQVPVPIEGSLAGTIFRTNRSIILNNAEQDPRHYRWSLNIFISLLKRWSASHADQRSRDGCAGGSQ